MKYQYGHYIKRDNQYHVYDKPRKVINCKFNSETCKLLLVTDSKLKAIETLRELNIYCNNGI